MSDIGVSGTKWVVDVGPDFCGIGSSSSRMTTVGFGFGFGFEYVSVRRFLEWNRVENSFGSSSSERMIGADIWNREEEEPTRTVRV